MHIALGFYKREILKWKTASWVKQKSSINSIFLYIYIYIYKFYHCVCTFSYKINIWLIISYDLISEKTAASLPLMFIDGAKLQKLSFWYVLLPGAAACIQSRPLVEAKEALASSLFFYQLFSATFCNKFLLM